VSAEQVAKIAQDIDTGIISASSAKTIFEEVAKRVEAAGSNGASVQDVAMAEKPLAVAPFDTISLQDAAMVEIVAKELNLIQKSDAGELERIVDQVLADNPQAVEDVTAGGKKSNKARGFLLGQVMQKTKGQANPKVVSEIMTRKLG
jgi:aspartyl-tRNA(Asn)/glutamyl-tRNA(Gln) amidotransferase subunit B